MKPSPAVLAALLSLSACRPASTVGDAPMARSVPPGGVAFVARLAPGQAAWSATEGRLARRQEAFLFDPATGRYARLTDTGGTVFAINVDRERRWLGFLSATRVGQGSPTLDGFLDAGIGAVDLRAMRQVGPVPVGSGKAVFDLSFGADGRPVWVVDADLWALDAGGAGIEKQPALDLALLDPQRGRTLAKVDSVLHFGPPLVATSVGFDGRSILLDTLEPVARVDRDLADHTLAWSPRRQRLAFAGKVEACKVARGEEDNALWVHERRGASFEVARARSLFESDWLDDERLLYDGGVGARASVHLLHVPSRKDLALAAPHGASLFGFPARPCLD